MATRRRRPITLTPDGGFSLMVLLIVGLLLLLLASIAHVTP